MFCQNLEVNALKYILKKPIYDIPAYPEILADGLIDKLMEQCSQFQPGFTLGERAMTI